MLTDHVYVSRNNSKLGAAIPSINLPPAVTCRPDAPCAGKCYAQKGRFRFANVKTKSEQNLQVWQQSPEFYAASIRIAAFHSRFFRWHSSGDIPDLRYLAMMVQIAQQLPDTKFLCFTKKYELVNHYLSLPGASLPSNLTIVFSAWGDFLPENPHRLPVAYIRFRDQPDDPRIPQDAYPCPNFCGECVTTGGSCWDLKPGQSVCFNEH